MKSSCLKSKKRESKAIALRLPQHQGYEKVILFVKSSLIECLEIAISYNEPFFIAARRSEFV